MTAPVGVVTEVRTTREVECTYSYSGSLKETNTTGHRVIRDGEDPRWDTELMEPPFNGDPRGYLNVALVTRTFEPGGPKDGEIVKSVGIHGGTYHKNKAQEFMRLFKELKDKGAKQPWDQEHFYRQTIEDAERLRREGRTEEMELLRSVLREATKAQAVPSTPTPNSGVAK